MSFPTPFFFHYHLPLKAGAGSVHGAPYLLHEVLPQECVPTILPAFSLAVQFRVSQSKELKGLSIFFSFGVGLRDRMAECRCLD
jgi:hypothetical protein